MDNKAYEASSDHLDPASSTTPAPASSSVPPASEPPSDPQADESSVDPGCGKTLPDQNADGKPMPPAYGQQQQQQPAYGQQPPPNYPYGPSGNQVYPAPQYYPQISPQQRGQQQQQNIVYVNAQANPPMPGVIIQSYQGIIILASLAIFANPCLGVAALVFAMRAKDKARMGSVVEAKRDAQISIGLSIGAKVLGGVIIVCVIIARIVITTTYYR